MITELGIVAGEIWHILDKTRDVKLSNIAEQIGRNKDLVLMSTGWLAREGHILLSEEGDDYSVSLRR